MPRAKISAMPHPLSPLPFAAPSLRSGRRLRAGSMRRGGTKGEVSTHRCVGQSRGGTKRAEAISPGSLSAAIAAAEVPQVIQRSPTADHHARVRPVPAAGFEPARTFVQRLAGPPRLPLSPRRHNRLRTAAIPKAKTRDPAKCCRPRATIRRPTEVVVIEKTHGSARSNRSGGRNPDQGDLRFLGRYAPSE